MLIEFELSIELELSIDDLQFLEYNSIEAVRILMSMIYPKEQQS